MWDAQQNYWAGHEWNTANPWQPTLTTQPANPNYAKSNTDPRYYNESFPGMGISYHATHTPCKDLPNANEMSWYAMYGDPRWDADELWTTMGHLYKGGMWFKPSIITTPRNLPTVQLTYIQHGRTTPTTIVVSPTPASHLLPTQAIISTCPPWVSTPLVSCTTLATPAGIGRQVLTRGTVTTPTACTSAVVSSTCTTSPATTG